MRAAETEANNADSSAVGAWAEIVVFVAEGGHEEAGQVNRGRSASLAERSLTGEG